MKLPRWDNIKAVGVGIGAALLGLVLVGTASLSASDRAEDAARAAREAQQVLCVGVIANVVNVARDDPIVIAACRKVGVDRAEYPPTKLP